MVYRTAFAAVLAGMLGGCATAADKDSVRRAWGDCVAREVDRLDDGRTDPVSVAVGVAPQCAAQYQRLSDAMISENVTRAGQDNMRRQMRDGEIKMITSAVLTRRAARR